MPGVTLKPNRKCRGDQLVVPTYTVLMANQNFWYDCRHLAGTSVPASLARTRDHPFGLTTLSFTDWDPVTLLCSGVHVWGTEP